MAASIYSINQYNVLLKDIPDGPFHIEETGTEEFTLYHQTADLITVGDYDHVSQRAYQILKENGVHYYLIDQPRYADGQT